MSVFYRFAYLIGMTPWEDMASLPISKQISVLLDREQQERQAPYGRALDLGCGNGNWSIELARRGWQVTGLDIVPKALRIARKRSTQAGVEVQFVAGDMTSFGPGQVGSGFEFFLDFGAFHGLKTTQRPAVGMAVNSVAASGATMLMLAWRPGRRGPLPRGISSEEILESFPGWRLIAEDSADVSGAPEFIQKARPSFFRFQRL